jgi:hypothetical protein
MESVIFPRLSRLARHRVPSFGHGAWKSAAALALVIGTSIGCTADQYSGQSSSYVIVQSLQAASGAEPDEFGGTLSSDVQTLVETNINGQQVKSPTIYEDLGRVTLQLAMKNPPAAGGLDPTTTNFITLNRYRVTFVRADGRNAPGVDVPYPFDGAITVTVAEDPVTVSMTLVRIQSKLEQPLLPLVGGGGALAISTIAEVTFYGADQTGRDVAVSGRISVTFADWGDPE